MEGFEKFSLLTSGDLLFIGILALIFLGINMYPHFSGSHKAKIEKKEELKKKYKGKTAYICEGDEEINTNVVQLYGDVVGGTIRPGMTLIDHNGIGFRITEVFANDSNPQDSDKEITDGSGDCALVLETSGWDYKGFRSRLKKEKLVALEIK